MLPVNYGSHTAYQNTFVSEFLNLFPDPFAVPKPTWDIIVKFWYLNLSETNTIMQESYSLLGRPATRFPSCLLRSYLLSIVLKVDSITEWCRMLKVTPLYAIPSGFSPISYLPEFHIEKLSYHIFKKISSNSKGKVRPFLHINLISFQNFTIFS